MRNYFLIALLIAIPIITKAQYDVDLDNITIVENRLSVPLGESSRSIDVITKQEIQDLQVQNINEVLLQVGGIDLRRRGANGVQADISFRGSTFEQVLVLLNGIKITDPQTAHHVLNLPLDLEVVERIEVVKGPAGRIYGQGAFAGAVNIVTKNPEESYVGLQAKAGRYDVLGGKVSANLKTGESKTYVSYGFEHTPTGFRPNADYKRHNLFLQSSINTKGSRIDLTGAYVANGFGANNFYAGPGDSLSFEQVNTLFLSAQSKYTISKLALKPAVYFRRNTDHYIYTRKNPAIYENNHNSRVVGAMLNSSYPLAKNHVLGFGFETRGDYLTSTNLGDRSRAVFTSNLELKSYLFNERLKVYSGFTFNHYSDFGSSVLAGIDASYQIENHFNVFANIGNTFRTPSYTELYYEDFSNVGNPNLKEESALNYELGFKYVNADLFGQISYFRREGSDIIDWIQQDINGSLKWQPGNFSSLNSQGIDFSAYKKIASIGILDRVRLSYTYVVNDLEQAENQLSRYALEQINHQVNFSTFWKYKDLKWSTTYRFIDRVATENYGVWDASVSYNFKQTDFALTVNNIFEKEYEEFPGLTMPKGWWTFQIQTKLWRDK